MNAHRFEAGASLVGILIALVIVCLLMFAGSRIYMGERPKLDKETAEVLEESGIRTNSNGAVLQSAKEKVADHEKRLQLRSKRIGEAN